MTNNPEALLPPGFRFHPTDEELILHYLMKQAASLPCPVSIIAEVDIYKFDPWDLPDKAMFGDREWYFFSPRDRKYPNGVRPNRAAASGYWKATGTDKPIATSGQTVGVKKALVFYRGKPPKGIKTKWIMHEYRLVENRDANHNRTMKHRDSMRLDDWVLCRIYRKSGNNPTISSSDHGDHDDINSETAYPPAPAGHGAGPSRGDVRLPKSPSLSQLLLEDADYSVLSRLLYENPSDMVYPELIGSHLSEVNPNHLSRLYGGGNGTDTFGCQPPMTHPMEAQPNSVAAGSRHKRQRPASDYANGVFGSPLLQPKKYATAPFFSYANMSNSAAAGGNGAPSVQCNMLGESQTFLHQQMLLNPHPGLQ